MSTKYRIYYSDGHCTENVPPNEVEPRKVQIIVQKLDCDTAAKVVQGYDYYTWRGGRWWGAEQGGMTLYLIDPGWKVVLFGEWIPNDEWDAITREAEEWRDKWSCEELT